VRYRAEVTLREPFGMADPLLARGFRAVGDQAARGWEPGNSGWTAEQAAEPKPTLT